VRKPPPPKGAARDERRRSLLSIARMRAVGTLGCRRVRDLFETTFYQGLSPWRECRRITARLCGKVDRECRKRVYLRYLDGMTDFRRISPVACVAGRSPTYGKRSPRRRRETASICPKSRLRIVQLSSPPWRRAVASQRMRITCSPRSRIVSRLPERRRGRSHTGDTSQGP